MNNTVNTIFEIPGTDFKVTISFTFDGNLINYVVTPSDALKDFTGDPSEVNNLYTLINVLMNGFETPSENVTVENDEENLSNDDIFDVQ